MTRFSGMFVIVCIMSASLKNTFILRVAIAAFEGARLRKLGINLAHKSQAVGDLFHRRPHLFPRPTCIPWPDPREAARRLPRPQSYRDHTLAILATLWYDPRYNSLAHRMPLRIVRQTHILPTAISNLSLM